MQLHLSLQLLLRIMSLATSAMGLATSATRVELLALKKEHHHIPKEGIACDGR